MQKRNYKISSIGPCTVDEYVTFNKKKPGGGGLNTLIHFRKILPKAILYSLSAIGKDENSEIILNFLKNNTILTTSLHSLIGNTSVQHIKNLPSGEKVFFNYKAGVLETAKPTSSDFKLLKSQDLILGVLFTQVEHFVKEIIRKKWKGIVGIDFVNLSDYKYKTDIIEKYIDNFNIGFFGLNHNQKQLIKKLSSIAKEHNKLFVITLAEKGSIAFEGKNKYQQKAIPVNKIVDTTGAGDAYISAFLSEYLKSKNIQKSLYEGVVYAAKIIQKYGAN
ncbi:MAG: PfkB family carbohydrate kinase [bacterium]|nr:PfkB family carbohydrate kinase [bacterium]